MSSSMMARFQRQPKNESDRVGEIMSDDNSDISSLSDEEMLEESSTKTKTATSTSRQNKFASPQRSPSERSMSSAQSVESVDSDEIEDKLKVSARVHQRPKDGSGPGKSSLTKKNSKKWYNDSDDQSDEDNYKASQRSLVDSSKKSRKAKASITEEEESPVADTSKSRSSKSTKEGEGIEEDDDSDLEKFISGVVAQKKKSMKSSAKKEEKEEPQLKRLSDALGKKNQSTKEEEKAQDEEDKEDDSNNNKKNKSTNKTLKPNEKQEDQQQKKSKEKPQLTLPQALSSPPSTGNNSTAGAQPERKMSSFQNLVAKTRLLSPFGSSRKKSNFGGDVMSPTGSDTASAAAAAPAQKVEIQKTYNNGPFHHRASMITSPTSDTSESNQIASPTNSATGTNDPVTATTNAASKRISRLKQQFLSGEASTNTSNTTPAMEPKILEVIAEANRRGSEMDTLSPSQRKTPGAIVGKNGSGVLLEGWLRQKQRRGVRGMKKWNTRYFVLYAKSNEIRYYTDVVQSAWGPIPLGEIGSISLRLIQRIGKPSHPKYKGCRFDITCRNSWGTHYAEDFLSSDEEDEKSSTPNASRVYSLMADCPQTAVLWVNMLDSLLVRSANSPRPDMASSSSSSGNATGTTITSSSSSSSNTATSILKKMSSLKATSSSSSGSNTQKKNPSTFDMENVVLTAPGEIVPKAVVYSMKYIFDSTPGIETESFYERDPEPSKLKNALKFLNQFVLVDTNKKPSMNELENVLDPITGGAIVKLWLQQMEQPIIPFEMYPDFLFLAKDVKVAPFELQRNLKTLIAALPQKNLKMLACLLFHLTEVSVYANKNGMDAGILAELFGDYLLRPSSDDEEDVKEKKAKDSKKKKQLRKIVEEMIAHVDAIIDEKEAEV